MNGHCDCGVGSELEPVTPYCVRCKADRASAGVKRVLRAIDYIRRNDCDFITLDTLQVYTGCTEDEYRAAVADVFGQDWLAQQDRVIGSDAARAVGRFRPDGPSGYRAKSGGPLRATRAEAEADERKAVNQATN